MKLSEQLGLSVSALVEVALRRSLELGIFNSLMINSRGAQKKDKDEEKRYRIIL